MKTKWQGVLRLVFMVMPTEGKWARIDSEWLEKPSPVKSGTPK